MAIFVQSLHVYPIKSLAGISLTSAEISSRGFLHDRRMMLVNSSGRHVTQRDFPVMALLDVSIEGSEFALTHRVTRDRINIIPETSFDDTLHPVRIWKDQVMVQKADDGINEWFSDLLDGNVELVLMPDHIQRPVRNHEDSNVGFADSNQFLILGESSLDHLNSKLTDPILMNRFRPNIVFSKLHPHTEDDWKMIRIGSEDFEVTKQCARCNLTLVNQETGEVGDEPIHTLSKYRLAERQILFGIYLKHRGGSGGIIKVGDPFTIPS